MTYYLNQTPAVNTLYAVDSAGEIQLMVREDNTGCFAIDTDPCESWTDLEESTAPETRVISKERFLKLAFTSLDLLMEDMKTIISVDLTVKVLTQKQWMDN